MKIKLVFNFFLFLMILCNLLQAQYISLVDFGSSAETTTFSMDGWNTVIKSNNQEFTSNGNGGLIVNASDPGEFDDFRGVKGIPYKFSLGERIGVTWYNNSDETVIFTARISFDDENEPGFKDPDGNWFTMRNSNDYRRTFTEIQPHTSTVTIFNIESSGIHKSDQTYSSININLAIEWGSTHEKRFLICDKIELMNDADISPPAQVTELTGSCDGSKIELNWNYALDDLEVVEYLIYMDGKVEGYSRSMNYTCHFLEPNIDYQFSITALDACGNESIKSDSITVRTNPFTGKNNLLTPEGFEYMGAFSVPEEFAWGGEAIAFSIDGDGGCLCSTDMFPGSLYFTNLNQPSNGLVSEVSIPELVITDSRDLKDLYEGSQIAPFVNIRPDNVNSWDYVDIWRTGMEYHPVEKRLYSSWSIHYTVSEEKHASISCCDATDLVNSEKYGAWYVGNSTLPPLDAGINDWLFSVPQNWADENCNGRNLIVGRCRDGGLSGLGPTLYAFSSIGDTPPLPESELDITTLLEYGSVENSDNYNFPNSINGYKHSDDWREAVWMNSTGQNAIGVIGHKALGHNWYGYHGEQFHNEWATADVPYPDFWETDPDGKGWRAHNLQPMIILYDPEEIAKVAFGQLESHVPQPYAALRIDKDLFWGKDHEIFSASFDTLNHYLYVTEFLREYDGRLIVHGWKTNYVETSTISEQSASDFFLSQNYPNPFNPFTTIRYQIPSKQNVNLSVYDVNGKLVKTLINSSQNMGKYKIIWNGTNEYDIPVSSGIYFYKILGMPSVIKKMVLIK